MAEYRSILKNNHITYHPSFGFTRKTGIAFLKTGVLFLLTTKYEKNKINKKNAGLAFEGSRSALEAFALPTGGIIL